MQQQQAFELSHAGKFVLLNLGISIPSGLTALEDEDFHEDIRSRLPPKEVTKRGRKAVVPPEEIRRFLTLRAAARREALYLGVSFLDGMVLVPVTKIAELEGILSSLQGVWEDMKRSFLDRYDQTVEEWALANPEMSRQILAGKIPKSRIEKGLIFKPYRVNISPVSLRDAEVLNERTANLVDELIDEIKEEARKMILRCFFKDGEQKVALNKASVKTIQRIRNKIEGLSFLDKRFESVVELLSELMDGYLLQPKEIVDDQYWKVLVGMQILTSTDTLNDLADGKISLNEAVTAYKQGANGGPAQEEDQLDLLEPVTEEIAEDCFYF